jgi:hypothetical protein
MSTGGKGSRLGLGSVEPASLFVSTTTSDVVEVIGLAEEVLGSVAEGGDPSMASEVVRGGDIEDEERLVRETGQG